MRNHNSIFNKIPQGYAIYGGMCAPCGLFAKLEDSKNEKHR